MLLAALTTYFFMSYVFYGVYSIYLWNSGWKNYGPNWIREQVLFWACSPLITPVVALYLLVFAIVWLAEIWGV